MDVSTGKIRPLEDYVKETKVSLETSEIEKKLEKLNKRIENYEIVDVPKQHKARMTMLGWGIKKRESYAALLKEGTLPWQAYYFVEYNNGGKLE